MKIEKNQNITTIAKIIEYIQFDDIFSLYKITTKINDIGSYKFGICLNEELESLKKNPDYFSSKVDGFKIFNKSVIELMKTNSEDLKNRMKEFTFLVPEMINLAEKVSDFSNYTILKYDNDKNELLEYNSSISIPKSIHFEYPDITSEKYNIENVLKKLKQRKDLEILEDKTGDLLHERNGVKFIRCIWQPSKYNWNIVYEEKQKHYNFKIKNYVKEKIFEI